MERLSGHPIKRTIELPIAFNPYQPIAEQIDALLEDSAGWNGDHGGDRICIYPPPFAPLAVVLVAELARRSDCSLSIAAGRSVADGQHGFEIAEVVPLGPRENG